MNTFNLLEKRRHVREYRTDKHPSYEIIEKLLWKTWKTTPSKNNFMPYNCYVLGPDKSEVVDSVNPIPSVKLTVNLI